MIQIQKTIQLFAQREIEFVIIGGVAISIYGSSYLTFDIDLCYSRKPENLKRIVAALAPYHPRPRDFPEDLPFIWDGGTLKNGTNFTLTDLGDIDLLGEVTGIGGYNEAEEVSIVMELYGVKCRVLSLDALIKAKRAAGRPKDLLVLPELEALREML